MAAARRLREPFSTPSRALACKLLPSLPRPSRSEVLGKPPRLIMYPAQLAVLAVLALLLGLLLLWLALWFWA